MSTELDRSVELLERSLGYARGALAAVTATPLTRPTPCAGWDLMHLLAHMDDALDTFLEAAAGAVTVPEDTAPRHVAATRPGDRVEILQEKACTLLGTWMQATEAGIQQVRVGGLSVPTGLLVGTAALEISVHGWDVAQSTGAGTRLPSDLAAALLPTARRTVGEQDRPQRFAAVRRSAPGAPSDERLLAFLGRGPLDRR